MTSEVRIHVDVDATGHYAFRVRSGTGKITTTVNPDLAASFYEDLRLLRWKSAGVHDQGDILLNHVGDRLAALIAPSATWEQLGLPDGARRVRIQFSQAAHPLMPFPWELLRINDQFLIGARGGHLVREVPAPAPRRRRRNPVTSVMHVSLGTDSALRLDEERCTLLETIPASIPIEFLIDPSVGHLDAGLDGFRPHIVIVSGHGHYNDLRGEHYLSARDDSYLIRTAQLVARCASYGCHLLVLSTCESARLGGPVIDDGTVLPADLIAFSFPVRTTTATQSLACLLQELVRGQTIDDAMAEVRAIDTEDDYAFFNAVHLHRGRARSLCVNDIVPPPGLPATRCPGMELTLGTLNSFAHWEEPTTVLASVGSGGESLIHHWAQLAQRSQTQARRWRVLLDGAPIVDVEGAQLVRLAYPH